MNRILGQRGANAIEFALVLPIFLMVLSAALDYGWYFTQLSAVQQSAFDGGRRASMADPADAVAVAEQAIGDELAAKGLNGGTVAASAVVIGGQDALRVEVAVPYDSLLGFGTVSMPDDLSHALTVRLEQQ